MSDERGKDGVTGTLPLHTGRRAERPARRVLLAVGPALQTTYPLGPSGTVSIGRASDNLLPIDDPTISRHHVVLHLGPTLVVEDLGSSNGTRVGGRKLDPKEIVTIGPGEPIEIGSTMLIVQDRTPEAPPRRLVSWDYFELRIDEAIRRAKRLDRSFVILHARTDPSCSATVERRLVALLPQLDAVARDVPGEFSLLLVDADELDAQTAERWLRGALEDDRAQIALGRAVYPRDGTTVDELTTFATGRVAGLEGDREPDAPVVEDETSHRLFRLIERVAASPLHVLVTGETGVGKSVVVAELARRSGREPVVVVDCAADEPHSLGDILFGDAGRFAAARGGMLVLDKICTLPLQLQDRLVAAIEREGPDAGGPCVRLVAVTNRDVQAEVEAGRMRGELYFLLQTVVLDVLPLRRRRADIEPMARRFAAEAAATAGRAVPDFDPQAVELLRNHAWPGNVRELRNVIWRAVVLCEGMLIGRRHLPVEKLTAAFVPETETPPTTRLFDAVRHETAQVERDRIVDALERSAGNQTEAARLLGISRRTLINRLEAYGLPRPRKRR